MWDSELNRFRSPFLAYYGALQDNTTLMDEAYNQISLYRDQLRDSSANNLWKHIVLGGSGEDPGHWATGNGWAAMGMLRVMGTYRASKRANDYQDKQNTLIGWVEEIVQGMYNNTRNAPSALFHNYPDNPRTFYDASSTAFMAAVTYRLAILTDGQSVSNIPDAERARKELSKNAGNAGGHIDNNGWLNPVVDPDNYPQQGSHSPEGQAFVISMMAGYNTWNGAGHPGTQSSVNAAGRTIAGVSGGMEMLYVMITLLMTTL
jgi:rhamnogalacturonyl hydrolase YesR